MKRNFIKFFQMLIFIICLGLAIGVLSYLFLNRRMSANYEPASYNESSSPLNNPYCGFYQINGYTLSDTLSAQNASDWGR